MPDESYYDRLRNGTLSSLRLDTKRIDKERKTGEWKSPTIQINPERSLAHMQRQYQPNQPLDAPLPTQQRPHVNNFKLGFQEGMSNLVGSVTGLSGPYSPRLASGQTLSDAAKDAITNQAELEKNLAAQSSPWARTAQFIGAVPGNAIRYGAAEAATGGNPWVGAVLGAPAADIALGASEGDTSGGDVLRTGLNSAGWGGEFMLGAEGAEPVMKPIIDRAKRASSAMIRKPAQWLGVHEHELIEPVIEAVHGAIETGAEAGRDETSGEMVPSLFPGDAQVQSWVRPKDAPPRPYGAAPRLTDQQLSGVIRRNYIAPSPEDQQLSVVQRDIAPSPDNPRPLPPPTTTTPEDSDSPAENVSTCGRNSHVPCYAEGGVVESDDDLADDIGDFIENGPTNSPGPIHSGNSGKLTLDLNAINREKQSGPMIHVGAGSPGQIKQDWTPPPAPKPQPPPQPAAPQQPSGWRHALGVAGQSSGLASLEGIIGGGTQAVMGRIAGLPDTNAEQRFKNSVSGLYSGIVGEPERIRQELLKTNEALRHGDINTAADHLWFTVPLLGGIGAQMKDYLEKGDYWGALGHATGALGAAATADAMPGPAEGLGAVKKQVQRVSESLPTHEELRATANAADARLRASGIYSGASAGAGQFLNPSTIRDMAISTGAHLGSGVHSAAEIAAARSRQVQQLIRNISPPPVEETAPVADFTQVRDVKKRTLEDLDRRIPDKERTVSPDPTKLINGQPFSSLDMNARSEGFLPYFHFGPEAAEDLNQRLFADSVRESEMPGGSAAIDAVRRTGMKPPTADFLHRAFSQPQRARYWYELSGDAFTKDYMDIPAQMQPGFIDTVAATSGGAKPYANLKRAIGSYAENLQNAPIYTDLRDPASVRHALDPALQRMQTNKYDNFSGTMQYTSGLSPRAPLSVNDVQMADMYGIRPEDIGKNPVLYEVMSRHANKIRDAQNALLPEGAQPWETWQVQAPGWTQQRLDKDPTSTYDDYAMVFPKIIKELNDAGVPTPNGKITMQTLMDQRTPNVMSGTRQNFMGTPTGTVEFATTKTPAGSAAAQMRAQLEQYDPNEPWVRDAKARYEQIQRNAMTDFAQRHNKQPSLVSQLMSAITGQKLETSRLEWNGYGTYEGEINPNLRIPMGGAGSKGFVALTQPQREAFLSMLGEDLNQDAMAASHFTTVPADQAHTYSVFMRRFDARVDQHAIQQFSKEIGYPVNVSQTPNGVLVDVNIGGYDTRPTYEQVHNAAANAFGDDPGVHDIGILPRSYASDYVHNSEYRSKIDAQAKTAQPGRGRRAGNTQNNVGDIERIRQEVRRIAQTRDAEFAQWTQDAQARIGKMSP